jgi:biotin carboxyl carrier protein
MSPAAEFSLTLDGTPYKIVVDGNSILVNGQPFIVGLEEGRVLVDGIPYEVKLAEHQAVIGGIAYGFEVEGLEQEPTGRKATAAAVAGAGSVVAIMPGKLIKLLVNEGDQVAEGDVVCILEAMKMENELKAPRAGTVTAVHVQPGQDVEMGAILADIE